MGNKQPLFFHFKSTVMRSIFSLAIVGMFLASGAIRADVVLASNTSSTNSALKPFTEVEFAVGYNSPEIRFTKMRLFYQQTNVGDTVTARFHDNDAHDTGVLTGTKVGTSGTQDIYEFNFGSTFLGNQSIYYAAYAFNINGAAVSIGSTTDNSISYVSGLSTVTYNYWQPNNASTAGYYARFELIGVPEPGTMMLGSVAALCGAGAWWRRRRAKGKHADNRMEANGQAN